MKCSNNVFSLLRNMFGNGTKRHRDHAERSPLSRGKRTFNLCGPLSSLCRETISAVPRFPGIEIGDDRDGRPFSPAQTRGLGREITVKLTELSAGHKKIILYANPGTESFYEKLGFRRMKTAMAIFSDQERVIRRGLVEGR
jgi:hypothetical protein